jgi:glycosyltransferase involved in cell wall biosynthesis
MRASVVVPTYERPERLRETLETVTDQTAEDYEIIVVDDGSVDPQQTAVLADVEANPRIRVLRQKNSGPAAARNRGWRAADGEFVLFTDDDCLVPRDWVDRLVEGFEGGIGGVGGPLLPTEEAVDRSVFARFHMFRNRHVYDQPETETVGGTGLTVGGTANVAYRRAVLDDVGGFDESFPTAAGEDADLERRVVNDGHRLKFVPVTVDHNDVYDWSSFVERCVRHGKGDHYYRHKHGPERPVWRVLVGLLAAPLAFPAALVWSRRPVLAALLATERGLARAGELQAAWQGSRA